MCSVLLLDDLAQARCVVMILYYELRFWDTGDITYICHFLIVAAITELKVVAF